MLAGLRQQPKVLLRLSELLCSPKQDMLRKHKLRCKHGLLRHGPWGDLSKPKPDLLREHSMQHGPSLLRHVLSSTKPDMLRKRNSLQPGHSLLRLGPCAVLSKSKPDMLRKHSLPPGPDLLR